MAISKNKLVFILEWYTYDHIPYRRHTLVVGYEQAMAYKGHPKVNVHPLILELYDEIYKGERK